MKKNFKSFVVIIAALTTWTWFVVVQKDWMDFRYSIAENWLRQGENIEGDYNGDGICNFRDYALWAGL